MAFLLDAVVRSDHVLLFHSLCLLSFPPSLTVNRAAVNVGEQAFLRADLCSCNRWSSCGLEVGWEHTCSGRCRFPQAPSLACLCSVLPQMLPSARQPFPVSHRVAGLPGSPLCDWIFNLIGCSFYISLNLHFSGCE